MDHVQSSLSGSWPRRDGLVKAVPGTGTLAGLLRSLVACCGHGMYRRNARVDDQRAMVRSGVLDWVSRLDLVVLIPESTRKRSGGSSGPPGEDMVTGTLPVAVRQKLESLQAEVLKKSPSGSVEAGRFLPAYQRFDGHMYRSIPQEDWERRAPGVEVIIASALRGLIASRDLIPSYEMSRAEPLPPFGTLNQWGQPAGLPR